MTTALVASGRVASSDRRERRPVAGSIGRCAGCSSRSSRTIPGRFDPAFWLDYFRRLHADAATLSAGGIVAYYPTDGAAAPPQRVARRQRSVRQLVARLPRAGHARRRAHRSARASRRGAGRASRLDRHDRRRRAAAALGQPDLVGHLRARSVQLRVHGRGASRDRHAVPRRRHLREPLGAAGRRLLLRALPGELPTARPASSCRARATRATRDAARSSNGARRG